MPGCPVRVGRGESVRLGKGGEGKETQPSMFVSCQLVQ